MYNSAPPTARHPPVANACTQAVSTSRIAFASASCVSGAGAGAWLQPARMTARATADGKEYHFCMLLSSDSRTSISQRPDPMLMAVTAPNFPALTYPRDWCLLVSKGAVLSQRRFVTSETLTSYRGGRTVSGFPGFAGIGTERIADRNGKGCATVGDAERSHHPDRKSTRLNSSHLG